MKSGLVTSAVLHAAALTWGLWSFSSPPALDVSYSEALPVEIIMSDAFEGVKGEADAPVTEKPAPKPTVRPETLPMPAENVGDNETDLPTPPTPDKTRNQTPQTGAPKPAAKPVAKPEPVVEEKVAETPPPAPPEPAVKPEPPKEVAETPPPPEETTPEIDPLAEAIAQAEAQPKPEPTPAADPVPRNVPLPQAKPRPPAPVKVAEAKIETPKAEATKARETPKTTDTANEDAPETDADFEAMAAAAINKQKSAGGGAKRSTETASLGSRKTTGEKLSRSETDALRQQLQGCWSIPSGTEGGEALRTSVRFSLDASGKLEGRPVVDKSSGNRVFDESAVRAVQKCDREGFDVPPEKAEDWAEVIVNFDPSEMF